MEQACEFEAMAWPPEIPDQASFRAYFDENVRRIWEWDFMTEAVEGNWDAPLCGWEIYPAALEKFPGRRERG